MTQLLYTYDELVAVRSRPGAVHFPTVRVVILHDTDGFIKFDDGIPELKVVYNCRGRMSATSGELLEECFEEFNIGERSAVALEYRSFRLRSLSKGDVIVLGNVPWRCNSAGWTEFPPVPEPRK